MGAKLGITHTQLNIVALAGNVGVYTTGPVWGRIVDSRGPRILLCCAFVFLLGGYMGMRYLYDAGLPEGVNHLSVLSFAALVLCSYLTGAGGNGGLTSSVNSTARTFPDQMRGITTGLVISGFGLSAFLFSTISHTFFPGNTSTFLFILAVGTAFPMILGFFFIRPIPLPPHKKTPHDEYDAVPEEGAEGTRDGPESALLHDEDDAEEDDDEDPSTSPVYVAEAGVAPEHRRRERDVEMSPQLRFEGRELDVDHDRRTDRSLSRGAAITHDTLPNVYGLKLWKSSDFHLLFSILSLLSGTGLMYINNVGSMSQALYAFNNPHYDPKKAAQWQSIQVSSISLMNCAGRILIGVISDFAKNRFDIPRSYCLVLVSLTCCISQVIAARVDRIADLWVASSVLGLGYGAVFSLLPTVCLEWFGMPHFSENWGYLSMSPMIAGNLFSILFGWNLDKNEDKMPKHSAPAAVSLGSAVSAITARASLPSAEVRCSRGPECYVDSIYVTIAATFFAVGLSVWAGMRDRKKIKMALGRREVLRREQD
ncbi:hypothetical protein EST38_g10027 [Candolleomyces aberdarensis]|uniref:MFS general substrate transporter n=1 Tax=Candolleomyces aberdarensis TaxID=2316362 RepID=A0A4Q2DAV2_9AGAR|nr:hypothetical protein EST38_g10027 [Candolleomyces aberdarensis]